MNVDLATSGLKRFSGVNNRLDCVAFVGESVTYWRDLFGKYPYLRGDKPFGMGLRPKLQLLQPPFFPEDELVIWDCEIKSQTTLNEFYISDVESNRLAPRNGFVFGTIQRLIWGHGKRRVVAEMHYSEIVNVLCTEPGCICLTSGEKENIYIRTQIGAGVNRWSWMKTKDIVNNQREIVPEFNYLIQLFEAIVAFNSSTR